MKNYLFVIDAPHGFTPSESCSNMEVVRQPFSTIHEKGGELFPFLKGKESGVLSWLLEDSEFNIVCELIAFAKANEMNFRVFTSQNNKITELTRQYQIAS